MSSGFGRSEEIWKLLVWSSDVKMVHDSSLLEVDFLEGFCTLHIQKWCSVEGGLGVGWDGALHEL